DLSLESRAEAARVGASRYLTKPVGPKELADTIEELLALARAERPRVLVIDDDEAFCERVRAILGAAGMETHFATDVRKVLLALREFRPEIVLLDVVLPEMTGYDLCRAIRTDAQWDSLPIVFVTAHHDKEARFATFQAGGDDYLPKPVAPDELVTRVRV